MFKRNAAEAIARLKEQPGKDIVVLGSGQLVNPLMRRNFIDEFGLLIHPLIMGPGRHLFTDSDSLALKLVDTKTTTSGVVVATYQPAPSTG